MRIIQARRYEQLLEVRSTSEEVDATKRHELQVALVAPVTEVLSKEQRSIGRKDLCGTVRQIHPC